MGRKLSPESKALLEKRVKECVLFKSFAKEMLLILRDYFDKHFASGQGDEPYEHINWIIEEINREINNHEVSVLELLRRMARPKRRRTSTVFKLRGRRGLGVSASWDD
jgi:hypothetical protein